MAKLYTCTGDSGCTDTADGRRVPKDDVLVEVIGTLDEFSSILGVAKVHARNKILAEDIEKIQNMTFSVMAEFAGGKKNITDEFVKNVEKMTDRYCQEFSGFSLSGKTQVSAFLDVARCVVRRAERVAVKLFREKRITEAAMCWLNRTSDLVYAMVVYAAKE